MKKYMLGAVAVILALSLSAFTTFSTPVKKSTTEYVWFEVNSSGVIQNTTSGIKDEEPPLELDCELEAAEFCSFGYNTTDTNLNPDGVTYTIKPEVGGFTHLNGRDAERMKD